MTPFATGYTEAALAELNSRRIRATNEGLDPYTVDDLAPATLARIIGDCDRLVAYSRDVCKVGGYERSTLEGRWFWDARQRGEWTEKAFPPLTPYLGDDGLIYLREAP